MPVKVKQLLKDPFAILILAVIIVGLIVILLFHQGPHQTAVQQTSPAPPKDDNLTRQAECNVECKLDYDHGLINDQQKRACLYECQLKYPY